MLNATAVRPENVPKDYDFGFDISKCEAVLPAGTIDHSVEPVDKEVLLASFVSRVFLH